MNNLKSSEAYQYLHSNKNSQLIIQKTRLDATWYPPSLPPGCTLRLHPYYISKSRPPRLVHRRLFTLAHNASLLPLAKAPVERPVAHPPPGIALLSNSPPVSGEGGLAPSPEGGAIPWAAVHPASAKPFHADINKSNFSGQEQATPFPLSVSTPNTASPTIPCSSPAEKPGCFLIQMVWMPPPPCNNTSQHALGQQPLRPIKEEEQEETLTKPRPTSEEEEVKVIQVEEESSTPASTLSPLSCSGGGEEEQQQDDEERTTMGASLNGGGDPERTDEGAAGGHREEEEGEDGDGEQAREEEEEDRDWEDRGGDGENGGGEEDDGGGDEEDGGGDGDEDGEKDKEEDQDRQGEEEDEEEEEDFDDLTQDEDEEEVMSSASEESVLSVPELQETMKKLTWLAAERRLCPDGDSEEDHSPTSPGSQEEEEEEEEGPKEEGSVERGGSKAGFDEEMPSGEGTPREAGGRCPGRGRGRSRPHRGLRRSRQERHSKDAAKLLLLYDENILDNDPHRETKDLAFAQSYLNRVREALQDTPEQVEEFVSLLNKFEQVGDREEVTLLFRKLCCILGNRTDLLRDFAAFLHPEQALLCGLTKVVLQVLEEENSFLIHECAFEEQQAFDRSRRFLRQLEISFGDNPSHYQKIIKALQTGPDLSPTSIQELKAQMATLLKGHTHLQTEFWVFFDELRPPPARPGQFEEAHWPEEDGAEGVGHVAGSGASGGFEEVTLPELEEEEEGHKIQPMTSRRQRRKMDPHRNCKDCDWSEKDWPCLCRDAKIRRHRRKGCSRCHGNQTSVGVSRAMKSLDPLYSQISTAHNEHGDKNLDVKESDDSPQPDQSAASWESSFPLIDGKEEEEEEEELDDEDVDDEEEGGKNGEKEKSPAVKRRKTEMSRSPSAPSFNPPISSSSSITTSAHVPVTSSAPPSTSSSSITTSVSTSSSSPPVSSPALPSALPPVSSSSSSPGPPRPNPPPDLPVCAKNISLTASGEKVILWTREADRVILTMCQQEGANLNTFQAISSLLRNKTPAEVSRRFRDLMRLFRTAARHTSSEDEAPPTETDD